MINIIYYENKDGILVSNIAKCGEYDLEHISAKHRRIDKKIQILMDSPVVYYSELQELKKKKLKLADMIRILNSTQPDIIA